MGGGVRRVERRTGVSSPPECAVWLQQLWPKFETCPHAPVQSIVREMLRAKQFEELTTVPRYKCRTNIESKWTPKVDETLNIISSYEASRCIIRT